MRKSNAEESEMSYYIDSERGEVFSDCKFNPLGANESFCKEISAVPARARECLAAGCQCRWRTICGTSDSLFAQKPKSTEKRIDELKRRLSFSESARKEDQKKIQKENRLHDFKLAMKKLEEASTLLHKLSKKMTLEEFGEAAEMIEKASSSIATLEEIKNALLPKD